MQDTLQSIKKSGSLNPMWGKKHDDETKKKISEPIYLRLELRYFFVP